MQQPAKIEISSGTLEAMKWLAVILMTVDHVNTYLLGWKHPWMFAIGRVAFPLFGFVFAYNMARPGFFDRFHKRLGKLIAIGVVAQVAITAMSKFSFHLNIMFTLAGAAFAAYMAAGMTRVLGFILTIVCLVVFGMAVDYGALGMLYVLAAFNLVRHAGTKEWVVFALCMALLAAINQNFYALVALPLIWASQSYEITCPRSRHAFYAYYPAHLIVLAILSVSLFRV